MAKLSIRSRLTLWYAATLASGFLLLSAAVWLSLRHSILITVDRDLRARLEGLQYYIQQQQHEGEANLSQELEEDVDAIAGKSLLRIASPTGAWIYRAPSTERWTMPLPSSTTLPTAGVKKTVVIEGAPIRLLTAATRIGAVQIGEPLRAFEDVQRLLASTMLLGSPLLVLLASAGGYWMSGRALRPVDELVTIARNINARKLSARLPNRNTADELDRLAETLNGMLARLHSAFNRIGQFTADASHELRTPVTIISMTAQVNRGKRRSTLEHDQAWDVVLTQTRRMSGLIDDLLMLARADSETHAPPKELVDAACVLRDTCSEMQLLANAAGLELRTCIPNELTVFNDLVDLRRILMILVDNAIKYTAKGGHVLVSLETVSDHENQDARITVRDTGIGMAEHELPHIFDRFYRASKDRSTSTGGAGLGLPLPAIWSSATEATSRYKAHSEQARPSASIFLWAKHKPIPNRFFRMHKHTAA